MSDIEWHLEPTHVRLKFGFLQVGEVMKLSQVDSTYKNQIAVHSHGSSYGKKFKTKTVDGHMHIKRIS